MRSSGIVSWSIGSMSISMSTSSMSSLVVESEVVSFSSSYCRFIKEESISGDSWDVVRSLISYWSIGSDGTAGQSKEDDSGVHVELVCVCVGSSNGTDPH